MLRQNYFLLFFQAVETKMEIFMRYGRLGTQTLFSPADVHPALKLNAVKLKLAAGIPMATHLVMDRSGLATASLSAPVEMHK